MNVYTIIIIVSEDIHLLSNETFRTNYKETLIYENDEVDTESTRKTFGRITSTNSRII